MRQVKENAGFFYFLIETDFHTSQSKRAFDHT